MCYFIVLCICKCNIIFGRYLNISQRALQSHGKCCCLNTCKEAVCSRTYNLRLTHVCVSISKSSHVFVLWWLSLRIWVLWTKLDHENNTNGRKLLECNSKQTLSEFWKHFVQTLTCCIFVSSASKTIEYPRKRFDHAGLSLVALAVRRRAADRNHEYHNLLIYVCVWTQSQKHPIHPHSVLLERQHVTLLETLKLLLWFEIQEINSRPQKVSAAIIFTPTAQTLQSVCRVSFSKLTPPPLYFPLSVSLFPQKWISNLSCVTWNTEPLVCLITACVDCSPLSLMDENYTIIYNGTCESVVVCKTFEAPLTAENCEWIAEWNASIHLGWLYLKSFCIHSQTPCNSMSLFYLLRVRACVFECLHCSS